MDSWHKIRRREMTNERKLYLEHVMKGINPMTIEQLLAVLAQTTVILKRELGTQESAATEEKQIING